MPQLLVTPVNICIVLILPETRVHVLHFWVYHFHIFVVGSVKTHVLFIRLHNGGSRSSEVVDFDTH